MRLTDRTALVTGAASGIGAACARRLAEEGASVMLADIDEAGARKTAEDIVEVGGRAVAVAVDVTDAASVRDAVAQAEALDGGLRIAVNCAGIVAPGELISQDPADFERVVRVN